MDEGLIALVVEGQVEVKQFVQGQVLESAAAPDHDVAHSRSSDE